MQIFSNISSNARLESNKILTVCESKVSSALGVLAGLFFLFGGLGIIVMVFLEKLQSNSLIGGIFIVLLSLFIIFRAKKRERVGGHFVIDGKAKTITQKRGKIEKKWDFDQVQNIKQILDITDGTRPPKFVYWLKVKMKKGETLNIAKGIKKELSHLEEELKKLNLM